MSTDVEALRKRSSALEDRVLELLDEAEPLEERIASISSDLSVLSESRTGLEAAIAATQKEIDGEAAAIVAPRAEIAARVPPGLLETYERLRARMGGIGVAHVVGNHCDGCHLTLSSGELDAIRHLPDDQVANCEQCSRILVLTVP